MVFRLQQHLIIGVVGNGASGGQRGQPRAAPAAQNAVDGIVVDQRTAPPTPRAETVGQHIDHGGEILPGQLAVRRGAPHQREQFVVAPLACGDFGDDLLRQHVERAIGNGKAVELAAADAVDKRGAFHEFITRQRKQPPFRRAADGMAGAADPL